jgi:HSP20 family protein
MFQSLRPKTPSRPIHPLQQRIFDSHTRIFFSPPASFSAANAMAHTLFTKNQILKKGGIMNNIIKRSDNRPTTFGSVVDELFQNNLNRFFDDRSWGFNGLQSESSVPVNILESDTNYEIEVIAPGLKKEDFQLSYTGDTLTISFQRHEEKTNGDARKWVRREYRSASFSRSFTVDRTVDVDKAAARYENGVLTLTLPKKEEARRTSRKIDIQ